jgi:hypothetical protein
MPTVTGYALNTGRLSWHLALDPDAPDTTFPDLKGTYNATLVSPATFAATTRTGGLAQLNDPRALFTKPPVSSGITVAAWVKLNANPAENEPMLNSNLSWIIRFSASPARSVNFYIWVGGVIKVFNSINALTLGAWTRVVGTYNGTTMRTYFNGVVNANSLPVTGSIDATATQVGIGRNITGTETLANGVLDDLCIWDRALSQAEVTDDYNESLAGYPNALDFTTDYQPGMDNYHFHSPMFHSHVVRGLIE